MQNHAVSEASGKKECGRSLRQNSYPRSKEVRDLEGKE